MSKPKAARDRLFKYGRPNIRPFEEEDLKYLWAAYRKGAFEVLGDISQEDFTNKFINKLPEYHWAWLIEDKNPAYPDGYGPIGLVLSYFDGWEMEPHFHSFPWATPRNKVKAVVGFMQMARYEKGVGVLNIFSDAADMEFFKHMGKRYGVMYYVGKVPRGNITGDKHVFYGRGGSFFKGKKQWAA